MESFFLTGLASRKKVRANELPECVNLTEIMGFKQEIRDFSYGTSPSPGEEKVQVGKDQEKAQPEKDSHSKNRGGKKPN